MPARAGERPGAPHAVDRVSEHAGSRLEHRVVRHRGTLPAARRQDQDSGKLRHNLSQILEVPSLFNEVGNGVVVDFHSPALTLFTGAGAPPPARTDADASPGALSFRYSRGPPARPRRFRCRTRLTCPTWPTRPLLPFPPLPPTVEQTDSAP